MKIFGTIDEFADSVGADLGITDWTVVDQERIDNFARATDDHQWVHVDTVRAATGPYGGTIAHGLLTLSLLPMFLHQLYRVEGISMVINYGFNKIRFVSPVRVGSKLRAGSRIVEVRRIPGAVQAVLATQMEVDGAAKPACTIESVVRFVL